MGHAYFPTVLGGMLAVLGGFILFNGFVSRQAHPWKVFPFRAWYFLAGLILGVVAYYTQTFFHGLGIAGEMGHTILSGVAILLLFATFGDRSLWIVLFAVVIYGGHEFKVKEATILFVVLAVFSVASFVYGLGLPMNVWPSLWE
jgi:hypothetical protein